MKATVPHNRLSPETRKRIVRQRLLAWDPATAPQAPPAAPLDMTRHALAVSQGLRPSLASILADAASHLRRLEGGAA